MKATKKLLAILLSVAITIAMVPCMSFAGINDGTDAASIEELYLPITVNDFTEMSSYYGQNTGNTWLETNGYNNRLSVGRTTIEQDGVTYHVPNFKGSPLATNVKNSLKATVSGSTRIAKINGTNMTLSGNSTSKPRDLEGIVSCTGGQIGYVDNWISSDEYYVQFDGESVWYEITNTNGVTLRQSSSYNNYYGKTVLTKTSGGAIDIANQDVNNSSAWPALKAALLQRINDLGGADYIDTWNNGTTYNSYATIGECMNSSDAAMWMVNHLFIEGEITEGTYFSRANSHYDTLKCTTVLNGTTITVDGGSYNNYYRYDAFLNNNKNTIYDVENKQIREKVAGETIPNSVPSQYWPLSPNVLGEGNTGELLSMNTRDEGATKNYGHSTVGSGQFVYHKDKDLFFMFYGDDDVMLLIDGTLVMAGGKIQGRTQYGVRFEKEVTKDGVTKTIAEWLGLKEGEVYDFDFFQMERNHYDSNFGIYTNIEILDASAATQKTAYDASGKELAYGQSVAKGSDVTYGFTLTNNSPANSADTDLTFTDELLDVDLSSTEVDLGDNKISDLEYAKYNKPEDRSFTKLTSVDQLKGLLHDGIEKGYSFEIRGFKYNVGTEVRDIPNTVNTTVQGETKLSGGAKKTISGHDDMKLSVADINNSAFILDYAKTATISNADLFGDADNDGVGDELKALYKNNSTEDGKTTSQKVKSISLAKADGKFGTATITEGTKSDDSVQSGTMTYTPKKMLDAAENFTINLGMWSQSKPAAGATVTREYNLAKNIAIIPANNVYYEDDFVTDESKGTVGIEYSGNWTTVDATEGNVEHLDKADKNKVMGSEESLQDDATYTDGSVHYSNEAGAKATFKFKGTGVDVYSKTSMQAGEVWAYLKKASTNASGEKTFVGKKLVVIDNKGAAGEYYQIPTVSFNGLAYGEYEVELMVSTYQAQDGKRDTYYLDGIRVYNPLGRNDMSASDKAAYNDNELNAIFTDLGDVLKDTDLDAIAFVDEDKDGNFVQGDYNGEDKAFAPENEIYLAPKTSVVFKVNKDYNYYVGLKAPKNDVTAEFTGTAQGKKTVAEVSHTADRYYKIVPNSDGEIIIRNEAEEGSDNILAITKVRTAGKDLVVDDTKDETSELDCGIIKDGITTDIKKHPEDAVAMFAKLVSAPYSDEVVKEFSEESAEATEPVVEETKGEVVIDNPSTVNQISALSNLVKRLFKGINSIFG